MELREKLQIIINKFGPNNQQTQAIQEMAELTQALTKNLTCKGNYSNIKEEIADVVVMIMQLQMIFNINDEELEKLVEAKVDRTLIRNVATEVTIKSQSSEKASISKTTLKDLFTVYYNMLGRH